MTRALKDPRPATEPLFERKPANINPEQEYSLSRFEPSLKLLLKAHVRNTLDEDVFPPTKPQLDAPEAGDSVAAASLRSAKPTWARTRSAINEPRQRVIVFMAGGATYSEARACYETSEEHNKDVVLITSHMLTPSLFLRQVGDLSVDKRALRIPMEQPKPKAPAHVLEPDPPPPAAVQQVPQPAPVKANRPAAPPGGPGTGQPSGVPTSQMGAMSLNGGGGGGANGGAPAGPAPKVTPYEAPAKKKKLGLFSSKK